MAELETSRNIYWKFMEIPGIYFIQIGEMTVVTLRIMYKNHRFKMALNDGETNAATLMTIINIHGM